MNLLAFTLALKVRLVFYFILQRVLITLAFLGTLLLGIASLTPS